MSFAVVDGNGVTQQLNYVLNAGINTALSVPSDPTGTAMTGVTNADAQATKSYALASASFQYGFNGTTWDRIQVDGSKNLKVNLATALPAGTNIVGKVTTDQTTPGTTDLVHAAQQGVWQTSGNNVEVTVTPTVTASAYSANNCLGGIMNFAAILPATFTGNLQSITLRFKGTTVSGNISVAVFNSNPSNGTYGDKAAIVWNAADMAFLEGLWLLGTPLPLGAATMTVYTLTNINHPIKGSTTSLYVVVTVASTPSPASTSDFSVVLGVTQG